MKPFIYALVDPLEPKHIRYIGMAMKNADRPYQHAKLAKRKSTRPPSHLRHWIQKLQSENREYQVIIIQEFACNTNFEDVCEAECLSIQAAKDLGHKLTNATDGGEGTPGYKYSEEDRRRISQRLIGNQHNRGYKATEETIAKIRERLIGNQHLLGHKHSEQTKAKISETLKQHYQQVPKPVHNPNLGQGRKHTEETKQKLSQFRKQYYKDHPPVGRKHSAEARLKMSESQRKRFANLVSHIVLSEGQHRRQRRERGEEE